MKRYVIEDVDDTDPNASGIRPNRRPFDELPTGKVPRADLDRLLEQERRRSRDDASDATRVIARACIFPAAEPLELDLPRGRIAQRMFAPISMAPPPLPRFEAQRAARDEARKTTRIVLAIWAFALSLAGGLGYIVANQH